MDHTFDELLAKLRAGDESVELEAKLGSEASESILETVNAFSNEPDRGGGYLLIGVASKEDTPSREYEVIGIATPDKFQSDLATQCRQVFNVPVRPEMQVERHQNKTVIVVYVPEAAPSDKPVYFKSKGVHKGTYRRIGPSDMVCTDDDLAILISRARRTKL